MTRRSLRILGLLATLVFLALGLQLPRLTGWLIQTRLSALMERPSGLEAVEFQLAPLQVIVRGLWVGGLTPEAQPFIEVRRISAVPSAAALWNPRLVLDQVRVEGLTLRINAFPEGGDDIPKPKGSGGGGASIEVGRLSISDSLFILNHTRVPLDLDLPDFRGSLSAKGAGKLAGRVSFGPGSLRFSTAPVLPVGTEIDVLLDGSLLTVESARLIAEGTDLAYTGQLRLAAQPVGAFALDGPVDLRMLDRHVMRTGFHLEGAAHYTGTVYVDGSRLNLNGRLSGEGGKFDGLPVPRFAGDLDWDGDGVHIRDLEVTALGGRGRMDIEVPKRVATWNGDLEGADLEGLLTAVFEMGPSGVAGSATGEFDLAWPRGRFREGLSGRITMDVAAKQDQRRAVRGRLEWRAEDGVQLVDRADFRSPSDHVRISGRIEPDDSADLAVDAQSSDLEQGDRLMWRLRRALGNPEAQMAGVSGAGVFNGRWGGTLQEPLFDGRFSGSDVGYLGVVWGQAEWVGTANPYEIRSHSLVTRRPDGAEMWIDGRTEIGFYGIDDEIDVRVRFQQWPAGDFLTALGWDLDFQGPLTGEATVTGARSAPQGSAQMTSAAGTYYGIPFRGLRAASRFFGSSTEGRGEVLVGDGPVVFEGVLDDDGYVDGHVDFQEVDLGGALPPLAEGLPLGGRVSGFATLKGPLDRPRVRGELRSPRVFLGDEGVGALQAEAVGLGDGQVTLSARCRSPRLDLRLLGEVQAGQPYLADLELEATDTSLDPFIRAALPALPGSLAIITTGQLQMRGPLLAPQQIEVSARVPQLQIRLPDYTVRNRGPLRLAVLGGRLELQDLLLAGEGTDLAVDGSAALLEDGPLSLTVRGAADLRALTAVTRRLRGRGEALLAMTVEGTRDTPQVSGTLQLDGAGIRARGFPHGIDDVRGAVRFTERAASFEELTGRLGGGAVQLTGQAAYRGGALSTFEIEASGRRLSFRYPEGLRSQLDADIRFFGDAEQQWLTGSIDVLQANWTRRYDLASELMASHEGWEQAGSLEEGVHYDLRLRAPGTLRIDNNLATLQARADLRVQGTYGTPVILGRAEIERGRVYFQGNTYVIRRGAIDFSNPQRIDPRFDIEAETRLQSYRVTLTMNGTLDRVSPTLTSDPPLSAVQILSLLAGADEADVASLTRVRTDQANLAATGAATLAAGRLSEEVGLERGAERLFGLNRFSIDPSAIKGGVNNPTARLTVGKRITPDLNVVYSVDLRGREDQVVTVEYNLSDRLSLLVTRQENPAEMAFDLRLIRSF